MVRDSRVLIIDDDTGSVNFLSLALGAKGFRVFTAATGNDGVVSFCENTPDLIILNTAMSDSSGMKTLCDIRKVSPVPILVVSDDHDEHAAIAALDAGACDYVRKPFSMGELLARVRAAQRTATAPPPTAAVTLYRFSELSVDTERRSVMRGDKEIHLTPLEYKLLVLLVKNSGRVVSHNTITKEVWGYSHTGDIKSIRVCVASLRKKTERNAAHPEYIFTEVGVGYKFTDKRS